MHDLLSRRVVGWATSDTNDRLLAPGGYIERFYYTEPAARTSVR